MCLIVDANEAVSFFCGQDARTADLRQAVFKGGCCVVYGGELNEEYKKLVKARRIVLLLDQAGKARAVPDKAVEARTAELKATGGLASNDAHIIALAQVSGSRLLHSLDTALHEDFTNSSLVHSPRGKVYQGGAKHRPLVKTHCQAC